MGVNRKSRIVAVLIALVMVMTSAVAVFASEESSTQGSNNANSTSMNLAKGKITVNNASGPVQYSVNNGKTWKTAKNGKIKGLKNGKLVIIRTADGTSYRWMKAVKITRARKGKVKWKKVKGASYYLVKIVKDGQTTYQRVNGKSIKVPKGAKVSVRPIKVKGGNVYAGAFRSRKVK